MGGTRRVSKRETETRVWKNELMENWNRFKRIKGEKRKEFKGTNKIKEMQRGQLYRDNGILQYWWHSFWKMFILPYSKSTRRWPSLAMKHMFEKGRRKGKIVCHGISTDVYYLFI
jgi:hypothetical protein